jgi:hypothetical protein
MKPVHNYRAALDVAMTLLLHIVDHCRRASERGRWAECVGAS